MIEDLKKENSNFSEIYQEIDGEKENFKKQNSILRATLLSYNPNIKFENESKKKLDYSKCLNEESNKMFFDMVKIIKNELQKMNSNNSDEYQQYLGILEYEYKKTIKSNFELKSKQQEFLNFLSNIQEEIEVKIEY